MSEPLRCAAVVAEDVAVAAQLACLLEASAPKPGNVSPGRPFADLRYDAFLVSAAAIGIPIAGAGTRPVGATVRRAIEATARWARTNTNLGIVLLMAPIARAALIDASCDDVGSRADLRAAVERVLAQTTVGDAVNVYAAIRRASPGGLGRADQQDVAGEPTLTLREVMRLAADRDGVAREYATGFATTFDIAVPALRRARRDRLSWEDSIVETFLTVLAGAADTHIERRGGPALAAGVSARARAVLADGGVRSDRGRQALDDMDRALRDPGHLANPGTTADLTAAAIFVTLLVDGEHR